MSALSQTVLATSEVQTMQKMISEAAVIGSTEWKVPLWYLSGFTIVSKHS